MQSVFKFNENKSDNNLSYRLENINNISVVAEKLWEDIKIKNSEFKTNSVRYGVIKKENEKYYYYCTLESKWIIFYSKSMLFLEKYNLNYVEIR